MLNPGAERLDYVEIRRVLVENADYTHSQFDSEVKNMVKGWHQGTATATLFSHVFLQALITASRSPCDALDLDSAHTDRMLIDTCHLMVFSIHVS